MPEVTSEIWKDIPGFDAGQQVSNFGRVRRNGKLAKLTSSLSEYKLVWVMLSGKSIVQRVHRLVLLTFVGPASDETYEVNHKNGLKGDNRLSNLEWVSRSENLKHAIEHGLYQVGEHHHRAKLSAAEVEMIRHLYLTTELRQADLANLFDIGQSSISRIVRKRAWKYPRGLTKS